MLTLLKDLILLLLVVKTLLEEQPTLFTFLLLISTQLQQLTMHLLI